LNRLFQREEGVSLGAYIRAQRCKKVQELLEQSDLSIREISLRMHFSSEYYLTAFFARQAGMTPEEYRRSVNR